MTRYALPAADRDFLRRMALALHACHALRAQDAARLRVIADRAAPVARKPRTPRRRPPPAGPVPYWPIAGE